MDQASKRCDGCKEIKPLSEFSKNKLKPDGLQERCKVCNSKYYFENADRVKTRVSVYRKENPEKVSKVKSLWGKRHRKYCNLKNRLKRLKDPERCRGYERKYRASPKGRITIKASAHNNRAERLKRTPLWAKYMMKDYMKLMVRFRNALTKRTGIKYTIDHIVPLQGELVSGLHLPWNLQFMPLSDNSLKCNKFEPSVTNY